MWAQAGQAWEDPTQASPVHAMRCIALVSLLAKAHTQPALQLSCVTLKPTSLTSCVSGSLALNLLSSAAAAAVPGFRHR